MYAGSGRNKDGFMVALCGINIVRVSECDPSSNTPAIWKGKV